MKIGQSFRLRLAVWSALLAGVALAGFAALAWWQMRDAKIAALDRAIRDQAERELSRTWPDEHWAPHERNMSRALGAPTMQQSLLLVQDGAAVIYRSRHWPAGLEADALPWPRPETRPESAEDGNSENRTGAGTPPVANVAEIQSSRFSPPPHEPSPPVPPRPRPRHEQPPLTRSPDDAMPDEFPSSPGEPPRARQPAFVTLSLNSGDSRWRFGLAATPQTRLGIGVDLAVVAAEMADLRNAFLLAMPLALGFISVGAWFLSGRALSPVRRLTATIENVTAKGLDQRIALGREDREFYQLIQVFNAMLERLQRSFLHASRFSADAAHELKTPLAILQGQIERAMTQTEAGSPLQARLTGILDEVQRLAAISRKLLLLSLADAGRLNLRRVAFDLSQALEDWLEDAQMLAPQLDVSGEIAPGLTIDADAELLQQVLHNLLGNAIKYNQSQGWIRIAASRQNGRVAIAVANASLGIPDLDRERIFERFYRADPARNRRVEGVGLGLSLSREIVRAHGGDLRLAESGKGETRFVVILPAQITNL